MGILVNDGIAGAPTVSMLIVWAFAETGVSGVQMLLCFLLSQSISGGNSSLRGVHLPPARGNENKSDRTTNRFHEDVNVRCARMFAPHCGSQIIFTVGANWRMPCVSTRRAVFA